MSFILGNQNTVFVQPVLVDDFVEFKSFGSSLGFKGLVWFVKGEKDFSFQWGKR